MKILITGANGFIGKHVVLALKALGHTDLVCFDADSSMQVLQEAVKDCDFVFHLAGVNRPEKPEEFVEGNVGFASELLEGLRKAGNACPIIFSSSIQAERDNAYGQSKRKAEELLLVHAKAMSSKVLVYRLPNVFGKWCRPNYNSAIATFCYNLTHDLPITVNDPSVMMHLVYIDDIMDEWMQALQGKATMEGCYAAVPVSYQLPLGAIVEKLESFKEGRLKLQVPELGDAFTAKLYATWLSYLPEEGFSYPLTMHQDPRGSFTEMIRTPDRGQFSVNITKAGITKGNHWHHTKNEKFVVVQGMGLIRFRRIGSSEVVEYKVSGDCMEVVDIPPGYTHSIVNIGDVDLVTFMWASEGYDPEKPDTFFEAV
jgi:UDP-2-acetamido-2,6-beta-L-arabino-hexul-4-ose reductase